MMKQREQNPSLLATRLPFCRFAVAFAESIFAPSTLYILYKKIYTIPQHQNAKTKCNGETPKRLNA